MFTGDDGISEDLSNVTVVKESENIFTLWCSGRTCCEGMLVELKLIKRQDLVAVVAGIMRPTIDQIHVKVMMNKEDMDTFVFCVASKKTAVHLSKDMADISVYCPEKKSGEKFNIPSSFNVMSEIAESTSAMLDSKVTAVLNKYTDLVDYIHISDQYSGIKQPEDNGALKLPDTQKVSDKLGFLFFEMIFYLKFNPITNSSLILLHDNFIKSVEFQSGYCMHSRFSYSVLICPLKGCQ